MNEGATKNPDQPDARSDKQERIRRQNVDELKRLCDRIGAEAQRRGLTQEILNQILDEEPTAEELAQSRINLTERRAVVAEFCKRA